MESSNSFEYQQNQVNQFMAGISRDLDAHVKAQSRKYAFNFETGKPFDPSASVGSDFQWHDISHISNSEVAGKKPRMQVSVGPPNRNSTALTLHCEPMGSPGLGDHDFSPILAGDNGTEGQLGSR